jgi:hypothetical protein
MPWVVGKVVTEDSQQKLKVYLQGQVTARAGSLGR